MTPFGTICDMPHPPKKNSGLVLRQCEKSIYDHTAPFLGESDHNNVLLTPSYKPAYKRTKPTFKTVRVWTRETAEKLKDCFGSTERDLFVEANNNNIDKISEVVTDYINYCTENIVPTKRVKCFANTKPWVTKGLKTILNECYAENAICYIDDVITTVKGFQGRSRSIANII